MTDMPAALEGDETTLQITTLGDTYNLGRKLGSGSFGEVYLAVDSTTGEGFAVKLEKAHTKTSKLQNEAKVLKHLQGTTGIASMHLFCSEGDYNALVMDLLGPSLGELLRRCQRKFSLKTVLMIADQLLTRLQYLHTKELIHRDIKPENFAIGHGEMSKVIYMIDFGLAKTYREKKIEQDLSGNRNKIERDLSRRHSSSLTGTAQYASINAHTGQKQSCCDDLEAMGYVLMYFLHGKLPWSSCKAPVKEEKFRMIMEIKRVTSAEQLCLGYPPIAAYIHYVRGLGVKDVPNYGYMRRIFRDFFSMQGYDNDGRFDWSGRLSGGGLPPGIPSAADIYQAPLLSVPDGQDDWPGRPPEGDGSSTQRWPPPISEFRNHRIDPGGLEGCAEITEERSIEGSSRGGSSPGGRGPRQEEKPLPKKGLFSRMLGPFLRTKTTVRTIPKPKSVVPTEGHRVAR